MPKILKHILIWLAYFAYVVVTDLILEGPDYSIAGAFLIYLSHPVLLFYALLYCYRSYNARSRRQLIGSILRFTGAVALFIACRYFIVDVVLARWISAEWGAIGRLQWWTLALLWISRYAVIALAFHYFTSYSRKQREFKALTGERYQQEQQRLHLENRLLRAQIDPHFLYNALNAFYARALPISKELGEAILKLSEIMRYAIKPNPTSKTVALTEELEHIRNVVDIARFRFNNKLHLELQADGDFTGVQVVPLAFITLAENVLKHANLSDSSAPGIIRLQWIAPATLLFSTWNRKRSSREFPSNGIGLNNTIQRLKDHFGDSCRIEVEDGVDYFSLKISLLLEGVHAISLPDQNLGQVLRS